MEAARYDGDRHIMERDHYERSSHRHNAPNVLLDDALHDLQGVLETAVDDYGSLIEGFDRDVQRIKPYAGSRIMDHLWINKVTQVDKHNRNDAYSQAQPADGLSPPTPTPSLQNISREVLDCFRVATRSHAPSRESSIDPQSVDRIRRKLEQASRDIYKLMRTAIQRRADTDALITEMEMVLTFLDKTGPQRGHGDERDNHRDQDPGDYDKPSGDEWNGQGGFEEGQGICQILYSLFPLTNHRIPITRLEIAKLRHCQIQLPRPGHPVLLLVCTKAFVLLHEIIYQILSALRFVYRPQHRRPPQ